MAYPYYGNNQYYMQNMQDLQNMREKIDNQMKQMQQFNQNQMQQQPVPNVTQNFQLAPNPNSNELESRYVNNIDEVKGIFVIKTGVFLDKDLNTLWIKNTNGNIRTFELNEIIETDPKDREIAMLKKQIEEMKEMIVSESDVNNTDNDGADESKNATKLSNNKRTNAKQK